MKRWLHYFAALLLVYGTSSATAQTRPRQVTFRSASDIPEVGIRLPVPQGAQAVGLPPPPIHTYQDHEGRIFEMQAPRDFWYPSQFLGRWEDRNGTRLTLANPAVFLPQDWPRPHVRREEYLHAMTRAASPKTDAELAAWIQQFMDMPLDGSPVDIAPPPRLSRARLFRFPGSSPHRIGIAFSFRKNPFGIDPDRWFFVGMEFDGPVNPEAIERSLPHGFLSGIVSFQPQPRDPASSDRFQLRADTPPPTQRSPAFEASRQRAVDSIRGLQHWWFVETPHYILVSDLPTGRAGVVRRIQSDIETLRAAFEFLIPPYRPWESVSVVRIFSDQADYLAHVGSDLAWSGGAWMPRLGELVIRPRDGGSAREQHAWLLGTVYHEAFHQYLHYALEGRRVGVWFNEGHATLFEGADIRADRIRIAEAPRHAEAFDRLVSSGKLQFGTLLRQNHEAFYAIHGSSENRHAHYARAWGLVYYLRKHAAQHPDHPHAALAARYVEALARGSDPDEASAKALAGDAPEILEAAVTAFWRSPSARRAALRFDPFEEHPHD